MAKEKPTSCTSKFVPVPRYALDIMDTGGLVSLNYSLTGKAAQVKPSRRDASVLSDFFENVLRMSSKTIANPERFARATFGERKGMDPMLIAYAPSMAGYESTGGAVIPNVTCSEDGHNIQFTKRLLDAYTETKDEALKKTAAKISDRTRAKEFAKTFPAVKKAMVDATTSKKTPACTDIKYDYGNEAISELLDYAVDHLKKKDGSRVITSPWKATCPETRSLRRDIVQKIALPGEDGKSIIDKVEQIKNDEIKDANDRIALLRSVAKPETIEAPYWKKNDDTCYFYYWNPHSAGFMGMGGGFYDPGDKRNSGMITEKIPSPLAVPWHPAGGWIKASPRIQTETMGIDGKCPAIKAFYSKENLSKATAEDEKFFNGIGYSVVNGKLKKQPGK